MTALRFPVGFVGLGLMGEPMALNLLKVNQPVVVWNRTKTKCARLAENGATVASDVTDVFARCRIVIFMLIDASALDSALKRGTPEFAPMVKGRTIVNMATTAPNYSLELEAAVRTAGARYVEAPVSGSRIPAETGRLIAMLAGNPDDIAAIAPLLLSMCRETVFCGPVPNALYMKLAVNLYMINMVTGLAEAVHLAEQLGLDPTKLSTVLELGSISSELAHVKLQKLIARDFTPQAAIPNVLDNTRLILQAAELIGVASPLLDVCNSLYAETNALGLRDADMVAVIRAIESRSKAAS